LCYSKRLDALYLCCKKIFHMKYSRMKLTAKIPQARQ
jgi:hypothetical protein